MAKLGEMLLQEGLATKEQLHEALEIQKVSPGYFLGDILVRRGVLKEDQLIDVMVRQTGARSVDLEKTKFDPDLKLLVPQDLAKQCHCIPVKKNQNLLYIAMLDPGNSRVVEQISAASSCTIKTFVAGPMALEKAWKRLYGNSHPTESLTEAREASKSKPGRRDRGPSIVPNKSALDGALKTALEEVQELDPEKEIEGGLDRERLEIEAEKSPVIRLVNSILLKAIKMDASDVHIEPFDDEVRVRFRIDGALIKILSIPVNAAHGVVSRLKIMSMMDISERRIPQDGRFKAKFDEDTMVDFRVNTLPGVYGEKVVLRILGQGELRGDIASLGFQGEAFKLLKESMQNPYGMILVTGPTGSGKTTTLYTILQQLNKEDVNIVTAEDPVEYNLKGITQVNVRPSIGFTFDMALRAFLRQDPDIILVGEMRDYETSSIAIKAALTGHLVLSTLHTNDSPSTMVRLIDMGIEPYMVASAVKLVVAQRLVRRICEHCKEELPISEAERMEIDEKTLAALEHLYRGKGCDQCNNIGFRGRVPVFEVMSVRSHELKRVITEGGTEVQVAQVARREGLRTLRDEALEMVNNGATSLEEAMGIIMAE